MEKQALVKAVRDHAVKNYENGGWDVIVECWEDADILKAIGAAATAEEAIKRVARVAGIREFKADPSKPFAIHEDAIDGRDHQQFATLAELQVYVRDHWEGVEYIDGPESFHNDYVHYRLTGATLADLGKRTGDGWDWEWATL